MTINGLNLPTAFLQDLQNGRWNRQRELLTSCNAYGEPLETEVGHVLSDAAQIQKATDELVDFCNISKDDIEGYNEVCGVSPGEIPYIWDFSKVICFAHAADDACFCFDFRENVNEPGVIWWADAYWQRVASNYRTFASLFEHPTP